MLSIRWFHEILHLVISWLKSPLGNHGITVQQFHLQCILTATKMGREPATNDLGSNTLAVCCRGCSQRLGWPHHIMLYLSVIELHDHGPLTNLCCQLQAASMTCIKRKTIVKEFPGYQYEVKHSLWMTIHFSEIKTFNAYVLGHQVRSNMKRLHSRTKFAVI